MRKYFRRNGWIVLATCVVFLLAQFLVRSFDAFPARGDAREHPAEGTLIVRMLDVGQGDAILVQTGTQNILIDTGDVDEREKLRAGLAQAGVTKIDKIILTHPHADHIGGMEILLKEYTVGEVYDNGQPSNSPVYRGYMKQLQAMHVKSRALTAGETLDLGGGASFEVLAPSPEMIDRVHREKNKKSDPNNECVVGRLVFGNFTMMFTGDAEKEEEGAILGASDSMRLRSAVLKVGHHGSKTSSSAAFLKAVQPETGLISCGVPSEYGHPHKRIREALRDRGMDIYSTPANGMITITSDGNTYRVEPEKGNKNDFSIYEEREKNEPQHPPGKGRKK
ncbi:ComEC/Rec2 family competence protein [Selenomonas sp. F0473]|uniref:ComEC/Rec2 family competence protein n=1 Tax=Selenomonas sp. F0473 TaxID=999423 RepID=UPI00029DF172|nr:ComEC/Rec2 family competence protein [Selenomonas sp. F0473]EKU71825.1 hypothetical protein HMPREF9161_00510 [Selenomonas sp. F0473]